MRVAAGAVARLVLGDGVRIRGALVQMGPHRDRPRRAGTGRRWTRTRSSAPIPVAAALWESVSRRGPQDRLVRRRGDRGGGRRRAARPRRADLRQAGRRPRRGADEHQRRQGRGDRRRIRRRRAVRRGECRRDAHAGRRGAVRLQPRRRHPGRHFHRTADRRPLRGQADQFDPDPAPRRRPPRPAMSRSPPRAGTTRASASAPCRWARRCSPASWPTTCCATGHRIPDAPEKARLPRN